MSWRDVLAEARSGTEAIVILQHGNPQAVMLSEATWRAGCAKVPVPDQDRRVRAASDVRSGLRAVRTAAHCAGQHTLIRKLYGSLCKDTPEELLDAVIAPYDWVQRSLPELVT